MNRKRLILPVLAAALVIAGCEELVTGEKVEAVAVSENDNGGYGPVLLTLTPDMAPVALNFRAEHGSDPAELDKWNTYRAVLTQNGQEVASGSFHVNHTGTADFPQGAPYQLQHMLTAYPGAPGDYFLSITPTKPVEIRLSGTQIEVRRNVHEGISSR